MRRDLPEADEADCRRGAYFCGRRVLGAGRAVHAASSRRLGLEIEPQCAPRPRAARQNMILHRLAGSVWITQDSDIQSGEMFRWTFCDRQAPCTQFVNNTISAGFRQLRYWSRLIFPRSIATSFRL